MRQNTAWTAAFAVAITTAIGLISQHGEKSPGGESTHAQTVSQQDRTGPAAERLIYLLVHAPISRVILRAFWVWTVHVLPSFPGPVSIHRSEGPLAPRKQKKRTNNKTLQ